MKNLMISTLVLASLFVGCKSSGGICCNGEAEEQPYVEPLLTPVAVMDYNNSTNILSCKNSYDRDENNQSIVMCDWNISNSYSSMQFASLDDINMSSIDLSDSTTETFLIKLKVTDDENKTDEIERNITMDLH